MFAIVLATVCWGPVLLRYQRARLQQPVIKQLRMRGAHVGMRLSSLTPEVADTVTLLPYPSHESAYRWSDEDMALIGKLTTLRSVSINYSEVTNRGLQHLHGCPHLKHFSAYRTAIDDEGLKVLAELDTLEDLELLDTHVTDQGLQYLSRLPRLRWLIVPKDSITEEGVARFQQQVGKREVPVEVDRL